jgi:hypothetical protein
MIGEYIREQKIEKKEAASKAAADHRCGKQAIISILSKAYIWLTEGFPAGLFLRHSGSKKDYVAGGKFCDDFNHPRHLFGVGTFLDGRRLL